MTDVTRPMMKHYNFDEIIDREKTHSITYDQRKNVFGADDIIPLWIADMNFRTPDFIVEAIKRRAAHEIYGYTFVTDSFYESVQYIGTAKRATQH
jgi:cystathionine beta-lyase